MQQVPDLLALTVVVAEVESTSHFMAMLSVQERQTEEQKW